MNAIPAAALAAVLFLGMAAFQASLPGRWMAHCHIAEHIESGMMFSFDVLPAATAS